MDSSARRDKLFTSILLLVAALFYALAFVHLRADFPNNSPWNDWSKTTDEGWYAGGAVHKAIFGRWITPGAFNPVVAMPVWPLLAHLWFRVAGFGIVQLRVAALLLYGVSLLLFFRLVQRGSNTLWAAFAVALLTANPFLYSFTRLALLEQVMLFWMLVGWTVAGEAAARKHAASVAATLVGLCITAMVLSKSTAAALVPSVLLYQWLCTAETRTRLTRTGLSIATAAVSWALYYALVIRRHQLDYHLIFSANGSRVHRGIILGTAVLTLRAGAWIGPTLYLLALLALLFALAARRTMFSNPLFAAAALAGAAYIAFICYHNNFQPRYYLVVAPCAVALVVLLLCSLQGESGSVVTTTVALAGGTILAATFVGMAAQTVRYVLHPQYTYLTAAKGMSALIQASPNQLLISNQGDNLSLFAGVPAVCDEFTAFTPQQLIDLYHPGWYATVLGEKPTPMHLALRSRYRLQQQAHFEIFDDPIRHTWALYRLLPR